MVPANKRANYSFLKGYLNPYLSRTRRNLFDFFLWMIGFYKDKDTILPLPPDFQFPNPEEGVNDTQPTVMWVNHSTFLIECEGHTFLVDPIWDQRCSPISFLGPKRLHHPPFSLHHLPMIDYVIISHNHYDHLDKKTIHSLLQLFPEITWIIPKKVKSWFHRHFKHCDLQKIIELEWWESFVVDKVKFTSVPAQHFSGRGLFDLNRTLWMGCVVEIKKEMQGKKQFYFVGDTGYNQYDFKEIGQQFGPMDLSLIPIGAYRPKRFMQSVHVNPEEAVMIHQDVQSRLSLGGHWSTFCLSTEGRSRPPYDLYVALQKEGIEWTRFRVLKPGQKINW